MRGHGLLFLNVVVCLVWWGCVLPVRGHGEDPAGASVASLDRWLASFQLTDPDFQWQGDLSIPIEGKSQSLRFDFRRYSDTAFDLQVEHPEYSAKIIRREDATVLVLPKHRKVFWGVGMSDPKDHLESSDLGKRVVRPTTAIAVPLDLLGKLNANSLLEVLKSTGVLQASSSAQR